MSNLDLLTKQLTKVTRPLDLGGYADELKGQVYQVWVNAPRVVELSRVGPLSYEEARKVVAVLLEVPVEQIEQLDDTAVLWLYEHGLDLYTEYHLALRKKTQDVSTPTSTPSETLTQ